MNELPWLLVIGMIALPVWLLLWRLWCVERSSRELVTQLELLTAVAQEMRWTIQQGQGPPPQREDEQ